MKIIKSSYEILTPINKDDILLFIESVGRTCYKSEDRITDTSRYEFVKRLIDRGHEAMIEHISISVKFICDRGVSHELVRHRIASFAQESTRYCNYSQDKFGNELTFILPCFFKEGIAPYGLWYQVMETAERVYLLMLKDGVTPERARSVLPNSLKTEIVVTANLREWRHILRLRTSPAAHPQMRELMVPLLREFQKMLPIIFDDILVEE